MSRCVGTTVRGIRLPIIKENDDLANIVVSSLLDASNAEPFDFHDKDVVAITESVVARAQGNYCSVDDIATDINNKFKGDSIGVIFPILSRNRFAILLRGIARCHKKIYLMLSYPSDEVGNSLVSLDKIEEEGINPYSDVLDINEYRKHFGYEKHLFTGVDYVEYYESIIKEEGSTVEFIFANQAKTILNYIKDVLCCDIHSRFRTKKNLLKLGGNTILGLDDIMTESINGSGYNENYGLLGSNKSTEDKVKLFPHQAQGLVDNIQKILFDKTGKNIEVMVYGDGAFKDPQGHIWELADPVVSPFHTSGLIGTPNELKLKYLADNEFANLTGDDLKDAIKNKIANKDSNLKGTMATQGTTPRQITDLLGSLCDLTSGSGDKGTPVVLVQGYFDNYTNE